MKTILKTTTSIKTSFDMRGALLSILFCLTSIVAQAQLDEEGEGVTKINGPTSMQVGVARTYSFSTEMSVTNYSWGVEDGTANPSNAQSTSITFSSAGTKTISVTGWGNGNSYTASIDVTVVVASAPPTPTSPTIDAQNCGSTVLRRGSPPSGVTWYWQGTNSNGTSTSNKNATYTATSNGYHYLRARNSSGVWSASSSSVDVAVNTVPDQPAVITPSQSCGTTSVTKPANVGNLSYYWQTSSGGTTTTGANATSRTRNFSSPTTIWLRSRRNNGCWSQAREVNITIKQKPSTPASIIPNEDCGITYITKPGNTGSVSYFWQSTSGGRDVTSSSATTRTRSFASATTVYLLARNNSNLCWSNARTVNVNVKLLPSAPQNAINGHSFGPGTVSPEVSGGGPTYKWYNLSGNVISGVTGNRYTHNLTSSQAYEVASIGANGCESSSRKAVTAVIYPIPSINVVGNACLQEGETATLEANGLYDGYQWTLPTGIPENTFSVVASQPGTYSLSVLGNGEWRSAGSVEITVVQRPTSSNSVHVFGTGSLSPSVSGGGPTYRWYTQNSGGTPISGVTGNTYTHNPTQTEDYYVSSVNAAGCESNNRRKVTAYRYSVPSIDITGDPCLTFGEFVTLSANDTYDLYQWTLNDSPHSFEPSIEVTSGGLYKLSVRGNGEWREAGEVYVGYTSPPTGGTNDQVFGSGTVTLSVSGGGPVYRWFTSPTGTSYNPSATTANYTFTPGQSTTNYYVATVDGNCVSDTRVQVTAYKFAAPQIIASGDDCLADGGSMTLSANATFDAYRWKQGATIIGTGSEVPINEPGTYSLSVWGNGVWVDASDLAVSSLPSPTSTNDDHVFGAGTLTPSVAGGGPTYRWYTVDTGGSPIAGVTGNSYAHNPATSNTYYVSSYNGACESDRVQVKAIRYDLPAIASNGGTELPPGGSLLLNVGTYDTYLWTKDGQNFSTAPSINVTGPGVYQVTVTGNGESRTSDDVVITLAPDIFEHLSGNRVISTQIIQPGVTSANLSVVPEENLRSSIRYFDGLGRTTQSVVYKASPDEADIVQPTAYDRFGRPEKSYMPYVSSSADGSFRTNALGGSNYTTSEQYLFYQSTPAVASDTEPYADAIYETSPMHRVLESGSVGAAWQPGVNGTKVNWETNVTGIRKWTINSWGLPVSLNTYPGDQLWKSEIIDEEGLKTQTITDKIGRTILKRTIAADGSETLSTYYVYDDFNRLAYTLPPLAVENMQLSGDYRPNQAFINELAYQYKYDKYHRAVQTRAPGMQEPVYQIYDQRNRVVMSQDGNQRPRDEWTFIKYDHLNRPVITGLVTKDYTLNQMINEVDALTLFYEERNNTSIGYTNQAYPSYATENDYLSVTYYDDYDFPHFNGYNFIPELNYTHFNDQVQGLTTGGKVRVLESDLWLNSVTYYDDRYRTIQSQSDNHLGGVDHSTISYDFEGKVINLLSAHEYDGEVTVTDRSYEYDRNGRVINTWFEKGEGGQSLHPVEWAQVNGSIIAGNTLIKNSPNGWGNSGGYSLNALEENTDGFVQVTMTSPTVDKAFGLSTISTNDQYKTIHYGLFLKGRKMIVQEGATKRGEFGKYNVGDVLSIERVGTTIYYKRNGSAFYQSTIPSTSRLIVDVAMRADNATLDDVRTSFGAKFLLSNNEYNALGQLIDKNIHSADRGVNFAQSVDYRYNIRGWLTSINNARLKFDSENNDDGEDYFGMEIGYNEALTGMLSNDLAHNGNITAIKWSNNLGIDDVRERGYNYAYDGLNRLEGADYRVKDGSWSSSMAFGIQNLNYDANGNINSVTRKDHKGANIDQLSYTYDGNQLSTVSDASTESVGFNDRNIAGVDYIYDNNGNMTHDANKDISLITYNHLNLPKRVDKEDGKYLLYTYDAGGTKLTQELWDDTGLVKKTDYVGAYVYENDQLKYIQHEEGRIVANGVSGRSYEYQYDVRDHLGNVRVSFTTTPDTYSFVATMESEVSADEELLYSNLDATRVTFPSADAKNDGDEVVETRAGQSVGAAISLPVNPGDEIEMEVYSYFEGGTGYTPTEGLTAFVSNLAGAFGGVNGGTEAQQATYNAVDNAMQSIGIIGTTNDSRPAAYLNYILFDKDMVHYKHGHAQISLNSLGNPKLLGFSNDKIVATRPGYIFVYVSNESTGGQPVYWDDMKVTLVEHPVIQSNDYYPFGMETASSYRRQTISKNPYMFNGGVEYNETAEWYETSFRQYDPAIGRFGAVDPLAHMIDAINPYQFAYNDPISLNDPTGLAPNGGNVPIPNAGGHSDTEFRGGGGGDFFKGWKRGFDVTVGRDFTHHTSWQDIANGIGDLWSNDYGGFWHAGTGESNEFSSTEDAIRKFFINTMGGYWQDSPYSGEDGRGLQTKFIRVNRDCPPGAECDSNGGMFFENPSDAYNYMWDNSFKINENGRKRGSLEHHADIFEDGILVHPTSGPDFNRNGKGETSSTNGPDHASINHLPYRFRNGRRQVLFKDKWKTLLYGVHTHPGNNPKFSGVEILTGRYNKDWSYAKNGRFGIYDYIYNISTKGVQIGYFENGRRKQYNIGTLDQVLNGQIDLFNPTKYLK